MGLAGHSSATVNSVSTYRSQNEGGARDTHSGVNVGKEGKERQTGKVGSNTPTKSQSLHVSSTPMQGIPCSGPVCLTLLQIPVVEQKHLTHAPANTTGPSVSGEDVNTSQLGHQNSMSSERTNRMQNEGGAQSSGDHTCMCLVLLQTPHFHLLYMYMHNIILCSL